MKLFRLATVLAAVLAFAVAATSASAQTQPPPKAQVCHKAANGTFHLITININATDAHFAHGLRPAGTGCSQHGRLHLW